MPDNVDQINPTTEDREARWIDDQRRANFMLANFKKERAGYFWANVIGVIILLVCAVLALIRDGDITTVVGMFGSSGVLVFAIGRLLAVFDKVSKTILREH